MLRVEIGAPSPLLQGGLAFIDTPGVGGHGQPHLSATLGLLPDADAMLMVSDTSQEFTEPEMWFIRQAHQICPVGVIVATKTDLYPHWREIVNANAAHLQRARVPMPIIPVSSLLRSHAVRLNDKELNEESNFPAIVKFLSEKVLSRETDRVRDEVLSEIRSAAEQLTMSAGSELAVVNDPGLRDRLAERPGAAQAGSQNALQADRAVAAGAQRRIHRPDHRRRPRPAGPVPRPHRRHRAPDRFLRPDPALGRDRQPTSKTRSPPRSATTSCGPTSVPRRWPTTWPAPSPMRVWIR